MELTEKIEAGKRTIFLKGRLDTISAPKLENYMKDRLKDCSYLLLDMQELEYISSAGLRVLLFLRKEMAKSGGDIELCHVNEVNMEVFTITGFVEILRII